VLGTATSDAGGQNLSTLGDVAPKHLGILVVGSKVLGAKLANLLAESGLSATHPSVSSTFSIHIIHHGIIIVITHAYFSLQHRLPPGSVLEWDLVVVKLLGTGDIHHGN
jgi:hypothetical protein